MLYKLVLDLRQEHSDTFMEAEGVSKGNREQALDWGLDWMLYVGGKSLRGCYLWVEAGT